MSSLFNLLHRAMICVIFIAGSFFLFQLALERTSLRPTLVSWMNAVDRIEYPSLPSPVPPTLNVEAIQVQMVASPEQVAAIAKLAGWNAVMAKRPGAVLLIDGQIFASDYAAVNSLTSSMRLEELPLVFHEQQRAGSYTLPQAGSQSLNSSLQLLAYKTIQSIQEGMRAYPSLIAMVCLGVVLLVWLLPSRVKVSPKAYSHARVGTHREKPKPAEKYSVRVVLVKTHFALENARVAIGARHILASNKDAFAFANGWILAVRDHTVFELLDSLGWSHRGVELFSESDLRHSDIPGVDDSWQADSPAERGQPLALVDALSLCGRIAHSQGIPAT